MDTEDDAEDNSEDLKMKLKQALRDKGDLFNTDTPEPDKVRLGSFGWKERYYSEKFRAVTPEEIEDIRKDVVAKYVEGLCWVMRYYYQGVCSWNWFFPYHYAPFASDLKDLNDIEVTFFLGKPFKPFDQLMGVLPAASGQALPKHYRPLMSDPSSPIVDFYPEDFEVDMNGKRFAWQGIALLPFIEEKRLLDAIATVEPTLTEDEKRRNSVLSDMIFFHRSYPLSTLLFSLFDRAGHFPPEERALAIIEIDPSLSDSMNGFLRLCDGDPCPDICRSPVQSMPNIEHNQAVCGIYVNPPAHTHTCQPPEGVIFPQAVVKKEDVKEPPALWHEEVGRRPYQQQQERPPVQGALAGQSLSVAAHRLILNTLQTRHNSTGGAVEIVRRQMQEHIRQVQQQYQPVLPTPGPGLIGAPPPYQQAQGMGYGAAVPYHQPQAPPLAQYPQPGARPLLPIIPVPQPLQQQHGYYPTTVAPDPYGRGAGYGQVTAPQQPGAYGAAGWGRGGHQTHILPRPTPPNVWQRPQVPQQGRGLQPAPPTTNSFSVLGRGGRGGQYQQQQQQYRR
eukprot:TRINITY_DN2065_c2_g4_i7.p1 TRINITY_DN2065_c2_g4~~TRINITY_DN2065_c2_g4_i7.p1  ORF type:complete len:569 (-),score=109.18 TRINITY_DN2065_c2_g4_i7:445-2121(-)